MSEYPRENDQGETVWACCESSIGPKCWHRMDPEERDAERAKLDALTTVAEKKGAVVTPHVPRVFRDGTENPGPGTLSLWFEVEPDNFQPAESWQDADRWPNWGMRITEEILRASYEDRLVDVTADYPVPGVTASGSSRQA